MTEAEQRLWQALRAHRFHGLSFRRQVPMGPFIADFVCHKAKLVIEVDGGQHAGSDADTARDAWFADEGYRVLRFWNNEVLGNMEGVLERLSEVIADSPPSARLRRPPPQPSPLEGEGDAAHGLACGAPDEGSADD